MDSFLQNIFDRITGKCLSILLVVLLPVSGLSTVAQEIQVRATIDSSSILIGDQTTLHLEISHPSGLTLQLRDYTDTLVEDIEILLQSEFDTSKLEGNRVSVKKDFLITCFDSGTYIIPPFEAILKDSIVEATYRSEPIFLTVSRTEIEPADSIAQIFDIKQPYGAPVGFREVLPYVLGGILITGIIFFLAYFLKKRKKDEPILKRTRPTVPAHVIALRELDKLKMEKLWQQEKVKLYYSRLTEILRVYLENRYGILAMEQTSQETLDALLEIGFNDNNLYAKLKEIFFFADLAKFARAKPLPNENETALLSSYLFVNETKEAWKKEDEEERATAAESARVEEEQQGNENKPLMDQSGNA